MTWTLASNTVTVGSSAAADVLPGTGVLTFAAGQASKTLTITVVADNTVESLEKAKATLSAPTGLVGVGSRLPDANADISILDDDP